MKKIILLALLLNGCAVYNTPGNYYRGSGYYNPRPNLHNPYLRHPDPYNHRFHSW